jgi:glyoxylase-like metal-dependent hydrolase (beta-lactamase superfamily II)
VVNEAAVFTGDTLFINGVGRPDLHADPEAARQRARALFLSLTHLQQLRPEIVVLPSYCRRTRANPSHSMGNPSAPGSVT